MKDAIEFHIVHNGETYILRIEAPYSVKLMDAFALEFASLLQKLGVQISNINSEPNEAVIANKQRTRKSTIVPKTEFDPVVWGYLKTIL